MFESVRNWDGLGWLKHRRKRVAHHRFDFQAVVVDRVPESAERGERAADAARMLPDQETEEIRIFEDQFGDLPIEEG